MVGQLGLDLGKCAALKRPKMPFSQAQVGVHRFPHGLCNRGGGGVGPRQVAGVNGINGITLHQRACQVLGLAQADIVEWNIQVALQPRVDVPSGFSVANRQNSGRFHKVSGSAGQFDVDPA